MLRYINQVSFFKDYYDNASSKIFHWSFAMLISEKHEWDCTPCNSIRKYCVNCNGIVFQSYIHESLSCSFICNCVEQKIISRKKLFSSCHICSNFHYNLSSRTFCTSAFTFYIMVKTEVIQNQVEMKTIYVTIYLSCY